LSFRVPHGSIGQTNELGAFATPAMVRLQFSQFKPQLFGLHRIRAEKDRSKRSPIAKPEPPIAGPSAPPLIEFEVALGF
jgi:hypothetical protein